MKTQFSVKESDFRTYSNAELSKFINVNLSGENINYNDIIESLPPKKQLLAYALIELYKRKDEKDIINLSSSKSVYNVFKSDRKSVV